MLTPLKIDNRIDAHLGVPEGIGKRPVIIHMHERYGIVQHTMDLGEKYVKAGYVTVVPDYFSRFTGDRKALAEGNDRCELDDEVVLSDTDAIMAYLRTLPQADMTKVAMSGVCQTGRQPILVAAKRDYLTAAVVLYGAVYDADWKSHPRRPESIETLLQNMQCPLTAVFGELDNLIHLDNIVRMTTVLAAAKKSFGVRVYPDAPHGFLNDTMPGRYRQPQSDAAWNQITSFLKSVFAGEWKKDRAIWRFEADSSLDYDFTAMKRWE
ncbi:MAG TPA: dienelactone hydrolase family protein [Candidatus Limnocylindria bacterium]|jgi:carboxymethylenebutenolidase|nr:dienelactone hydrolase family protein [Candidatus Limnocylindria bacterium]